MNWYKKAQEYDPFKIDWNREEERAKNMTDEELQFAIKDAYEAAKAGMNEGKYMDQISTYRQELNKRNNLLNPKQEKTDEELQFAIKDAREALNAGMNDKKYMDQIETYQQELNKRKKLLNPKAEKTHMDFVNKNYETNLKGRTIDPNRVR